MTATAPKRWPYLLPLAAVVVLGVVFGMRLTDLENGADPKSLPSTLLNTPAPALDLPSLPGRDNGITSADLKGHVTLVNFFGSWCATCISENPTLLEIAKSGEVQMIGVAWRDAPENTERWLAKYGNPFAKIGMDPKSITAIDFGVVAAPESYLIDKAGVIRKKIPGPIDPKMWERELRPLIAQLSK